MSEQNKARAEMISAIRRSLADLSGPEVSGKPESETQQERQSRVNSAELNNEIMLQCFLEMLAEAGGEGHILAGEEAAISVLRGILGEIQGNEVLISDELELQKLAIPRLIEETGARVLYHSRTSLREAAGADLGITTAEAGIADTGTVVLFHTAQKGRLAALLPATHVVLLPRNSIFPDKIAYLRSARENGIDLGSIPMTWVTGPSLTADIEKVLVRGAHGPRRVIVLLY